MSNNMIQAIKITAIAGLTAVMLTGNVSVAKTAPESPVKRTRYLVASGMLYASRFHPEAQDKVVLDFPKVPCPDGWKIEGYAFGTRTPNVKERQKAQLASRNQRQYQSGKMISPEFVVDKDYMEVDCAGVFHPTLCTVRLVVDHAEDGSWVIVLFEGGSLTIHTSKNLKDWDRHGSVQGFHECPELFPLAVDGDPSATGPGVDDGSLK